MFNYEIRLQSLKFNRVLFSKKIKILDFPLFMILIQYFNNFRCYASL